MNYGKHLTKKEILSKTREIINKPLKLDGTLNKKGAYGLLLESLFEIKPNSLNEPDFKDANIELKVTPYKKLKNGDVSSKERLVLNMINYLEEVKYDFFTSGFWSKSSQLLILFYEYTDKIYDEVMITHYLLNNFSEEDLLIIKSDWEYIVNKIKIGEAHLLSEADTMYLGACTKASDSSALRSQPFSSIKAKPRAFSLKQSYMTSIIRSLYHKSEEQLLKSEDLETSDFYTIILNKFKDYYGKSVAEFKKQFNIQGNPKQLNQIIVSKILNIKGRINNVAEFNKANITIKTIRIEKSGRIKESMSFPHIVFSDIVNESWDDSELRNMFETQKFLFVIFENDGNDYILSRVKFWNMPISTLDNQVKKVWHHTKKLIEEGNIVKKIDNGTRYTHFIGSSDDLIVHIRPHGKNADDTLPLPVTDKITGLNKFTKQCFWLNSKFVKDIISK